MRIAESRRRARRLGPRQSEARTHPTAGEMLICRGEMVRRLVTDWNSTLRALEVSLASNLGFFVTFGEGISGIQRSFE